MTDRINQTGETENFGISGDLMPTLEHFIESIDGDADWPDFAIRLLKRCQRDLTAARQSHAETAARLKEMLTRERTMRQWLLPDPHDEREVSNEWLGEKLRAALAAEQKERT